MFQYIKKPQKHQGSLMEHDYKLDDMYVVEEEYIKSFSKMAIHDSTRTSLLEALEIGKKYKDADVPYVYIACVADNTIHVIGEHTLRKNYH